MKSLLILIAFLGVSKAYPKKEEHQDDLGQQSSLSGSIGKFHTSLWPEMTFGNLGNIFYSPLSLHLALTVTFHGAPKGSNTSAELASLLKLTSANDVRYLNNYKKAISSILEIPQNIQKTNSIRIVNRIYGAEDLTLKKKYLNDLESYFASSVEPVDFSDSQTTAGKINQFVSNQTNGLIKELFKGDDFRSDTRLVLLNAIYFKGAWKIPFEHGSTTSLFNIDKSRHVNYSAMSIIDDFKVTRVDGLMSNILELPYEDGKTSMVIVLPDEDIDIRKVETQLSVFGMEALIDQLIAAAVTPTVEVIFPKFEVAFDFSGDAVKGALNRLGVLSLIEKNYCDLSEITDEPIYVDKIAHKAVLKVDEKGTEAAAATGVVAGLESAIIPSREFVVDRPFLVFIIDQSNKVPLFAGRIVDPSGTNSLI